MIGRGDLAKRKVGNGLRFTEQDLKDAVREVVVNDAGNQMQSIDIKGN
jgi:hypothetical protein